MARLVPINEDSSETSNLETESDLESDFKEVTPVATARKTVKFNFEEPVVEQSTFKPEAE